MLGVKGGDKVMLFQEGNKVIMTNASMEALLEVQNAFKGVANELNIKDEQDIVDMGKEIRAERSGNYVCE